MTDQLVRGFWQSRRTSAGLVERKALEPICTALLTHNDKLALQNCQKALRAKPYSPPVQTLFGVCLARQGQLQDALTVIEEVAQDVKGGGKALGDANMLCLCSWVFEQDNRRESALAMWELATQKHPANLELVFEAIYYFVRIGAFRSLEIVCRATIDAKHESHAQYAKAYEQVLWSYITAVVIQANDLADFHAKGRTSTSSSQFNAASVYQSLQDALLYFNADAMSPIKAAKSSSPVFADASVCKTPHTFYLLLKVLQHLGSAPASTQIDIASMQLQLIMILNSPQGIQYCQKDLQIDLLRREIILTHGSQHSWFMLWAMMEKKLEDGDMNWSTIKTGIHAAYAIAFGSSNVPDVEDKEPPSNEAAVPAAWWNSSEDEHRGGNGPNGITLLLKQKTLLERLGADEGFSKKDRGLTLGLLKLATWYPGKPLPELPDLVILYLKRHANKACCFTDLKEYLALLDQQGQQAVMAWLDSQYGTGDIDVETLQSMECSMTAEKVRRYLQGSYATIEEEVDRGHRLAKAYFASLHFGKDLIVTDLQPNDELALMAAQCYLGAWELAQKTSRYLELAIAILEIAIRRSKYRFQIRVLLIRLYQIAGAASLVLKHYKLMDTKQVQYDTLGHWALERGCTFFAPPDTGKQGAPLIVDGEVNTFPHTLESTSAWYSKADEETSYSVAQAWSSTSYYLLEDYSAFKDRLAYSLSRTALVLDNLRTSSMRANLTNYYHIPLQLLRESAGCGLNDNRDYSILPDHQPSQQENLLHQTRVAPPIDNLWTQRFARLYLAFTDTGASTIPIMPNTNVPAPVSLTEHEKKLFAWADAVLPWLSGGEAKIEDAKVLSFFKECHSDLMQSTIEKSLWKVYHIAQLALEAFCLLDVAFALKSSKPGDFKGIKQFKQIRQDSKGSMKAISSRLKALMEDLSRTYKAKNKLEALLPLKQFEQVSDDIVSDVATQLLESRKSGLLQLANAIAKRTAGP